MITGRWLSLCATLCCSACASVASVNGRFDENTGLTVAWLNEPVVLSRSVPRIATAARDYAYVGPLQINRRGVIESYVWVGAASTVDRAAIGEALPVPATLVLVLDGVPMHLPLEDWVAELAPPYRVAAPVVASRVARVAAAQLSRIAAARTVEAHLATADGVERSYALWSGSYGSWTRLLDGQNSQPGPGAAAR